MLALTTITRRTFARVRLQPNDLNNKLSQSLKSARMGSTLDAIVDTNGRSQDQVERDRRALSIKRAIQARLNKTERDLDEEEQQMLASLQSSTQTELTNTEDDDIQQLLHKSNVKQAASNDAQRFIAAFKSNKAVPNAQLNLSGYGFDDHVEEPKRAITPNVEQIIRSSQSQSSQSQSQTSLTQRQLFWSNLSSEQFNQLYTIITRRLSHHLDNKYVCYISSTGVIDMITPYFNQLTIGQRCTIVMKVCEGLNVTPGKMIAPQDEGVDEYLSSTITAQYEQQSKQMQQ